MDNDSKKRLRKITAIVCLIFIVAGFGFMVASLMAGDLSRTFSQVALACYCVGGALFAVLYFSGAFPQKQEKERERRETEAAYYNKLAEEEAQKRAQGQTGEQAETEKPETDTNPD